MAALTGISVVASIAMVAGVWGGRTWARGSFATMCVVTGLVAVAGGLALAPLLTRPIHRDDRRWPVRRR
ncbi:hypothetical protein CIK06_15100 [Plantactinospora sp. KBS50]|nr:hypothetical protein CIK06_15100 [Plantactinospora sp. KBS50]